jgi:hypothetical protein
MIGFRPIRSATTPQKSEAKNRPTKYDAPMQHKQNYQMCFKLCVNIFAERRVTTFKLLLNGQ